MMATKEQRAAIADAIWAAREGRTTTTPPSARVAEFTLNDGYAVAAAIDARRTARGEKHVGVKIGFTNTGVWESLGLAEPICAAMYDGSVLNADSLRGGTVSIGTLVAPAIEPEMVLGLGERGVAWWALGFEIVDCHYPQWRMTPADALADGALHAFLVIGERHHGDVPRLEIELLRDGTVIERGTTRAVLGGPLHALERLLQITSASHSLAPPHPGEIVTTGSMTSAPRIAPGEQWELRAGRGLDLRLSLSD